MSEFAECQNCGRRFFAENIECPYCRDEQVARERAWEEQPQARGGQMFRFLFASFQLLLVVIVLVSLWGLRRAAGPAQWILALEALGSGVAAFGLAQRRRWARLFVIGFILANAGLGVWGLVDRGSMRALAWGPGPLALLAFLVPFCSRQARERFDR